MKVVLSLVALNLILALAVMGFIHIRRTETAITFTIETSAIRAWAVSIWETCCELMSVAFGRRSHG